MTARCLRCGAGNEWIEGKATHTAETIPEGMMLVPKWIAKDTPAILEEASKMLSGELPLREPIIDELLGFSSVMLAAYKEQP